MSGHASGGRAALVYPIETRYNDYDRNGHVNNAVYLTYFEIARARAWLEVVGGSEDFPMVVSQAQVRFVSEARFGDPLEIEIALGEVRTKAFGLDYAIRDARDGRLIAEGSTVQVMFDYERHASMPIPDDVRERLLRLARPGAGSPARPASPEGAA